MLDEDPVLSGDKEKTIHISSPPKTGFPLGNDKYPETSIQHLYIIYISVY